MRRRLIATMRAVASGLTLLLALAALLWGGCGKSEETATGEKVRPGEKAVLLVLAQTDFQDLEYETVRKELAGAGYQVLVGTKEHKVATGVAGTSVTPDILLRNARPEDYLAVVFIGGPGVESLFNLKEAHALAVGAVEEGRVLGAICLAPVVLAKAGVLRGRRATVYQPSSRELSAAGAEYTGASVEVDDKIITADGPQSSFPFAQALIEALR